MKNFNPLRTAILINHPNTQKSQAQTEKLRKAIIEAEGKARVRYITVNDVRKALIDVEKHIRYFSSEDLNGISIVSDINAQRFAKAYTRKYIPMSTIFEAVHNGKEWMITAIYRGKCTTKQVVINIPEESKVVIPYDETIIRHR